MKRYLPFALMFVSVGLVYACSSSDETTPTPDGGASSTSSTSSTSSSGGEGGTDAPTDSPTDAPVSNLNPIDGVGAPAVIASLAGVGVDGFVYRGDGLWLSDYGQSKILKFAGQPTIVRDTAPAKPLGNTFDEKANGFVACEAIEGGGGNLVRMPAAGAAVGVPIVLTFQTDGGATGFDTPNDVVARKSDGTLYVTDPGYLKPDAQIVNNHIWRINGVNAYETVAADRPNGIALSPDEKTLYVGFTETAKIQKYVVNTDGSLGAASDWVTIQGAAPVKDSVALDGLTIDSAGNVYAATNGAVIVFKPDGSQWGKIAVAGKKISSVALGGADKKTLFIGTNFNAENASYQVTVKVAGK